MNPTLAVFHFTSVCFWIPAVICEINIALGKPASQSTIFSNSNASRANDGNRASFYKKGSCSHTLNEETNWWQVDLQGIYSIASVFIVNRDTELHFLQNIEIHLFREAPSSGLPNGTVCATHEPAVGANIILQCEAPVVGRYLRVYRRPIEALPKSKLVLCEVEVHGRPVTTCGVLVFKSKPGMQAICDKTEAQPSSSVITCSILCLQSRVCRAFNYVRQDGGLAVCELIYDISFINRFEAIANANFYGLTRKTLQSD